MTPQEASVKILDMYDGVWASYTPNQRETMEHLVADALENIGKDSLTHEELELMRAVLAVGDIIEDVPSWAVFIQGVFFGSGNP